MRIIAGDYTARVLLFPIDPGKYLLKERRNYIYIMDKNKPSNSKAENLYEEHLLSAPSSEFA
jgi:hypothetical protein